MTTMSVNNTHKYRHLQLQLPCNNGKHSACMMAVPRGQQNMAMDYFVNVMGVVEYVVTLDVPIIMHKDMEFAKCIGTGGSCAPSIVAQYS